jgi:hypothetical protein
MPKRAFVQNRLVFPALITITRAKNFFLIRKFDSGGTAKCLAGG